MSRIAIITYEAKGSYAASNVADEDQVLASILDEIDVDYKFEIWSDKTVDWSQYACLLLKSPWDYFDRYEEYLEWCKHVQELGIPVYNDLETVIWNSDKKYLKEIENAGFSIVKTQFLEKGKNASDVYACYTLFGVQELIVKPAVSGGAKHTLKVSMGNFKSMKEKIDELLKSEEFLVQPFMEEIVSVGEYSYIFFDGKFSHAVLKSAKSGDFRVQHFFGGEITKIQLSSSELVYLESLVKAFTKDTLYARVDGVWRGGEFLLMELELIEPYLFLFTSEAAKLNYTQALKSRFSLQV
ncbi:Prokaryotic glutathione synthetase, ATP-grasp domain protein [Belliella baltica DSM 15883]|uniref:Prokaryotic glutathione synthetase, ATP-grasp domain protein n=1 Tax=Belliella baltica (strain DSM 15883 / CIP 108006 / LMG 21964 / BA134) TaxID=866536 RepID=I3Z629_BELBD|nr:glutathione synthetase [Belliella baltica]AFL84697.1 Prokaryotic glutathione synthetase, ATP-grasp domain protein [Belliella baltica DSM 15883]